MPAQKIATTSVILCIIIAAACNDRNNKNQKPKTEKTAVLPQNTKCQSIEPIFRIDAFPEYKTIETDEVRSMGGRWYSKLIKTKTKFKKPSLVHKIEQELKSKGWKKASPPPKYVLSKIWNKDKEDLYFSLDSFDGCPKNWFFNQAIHINEKTRTIGHYWEVGW